MKLRLGDVLVWGSTRFEVIAIDVHVAHLRAVDEGFVREVLVSELHRSPDIRWPGATDRAVTVPDLAALEELTPDKRRVVDAWLPHLRSLDELTATGYTKGTARTVTAVADIRAALTAAGITVTERTVWRKLDAYRARGVFSLLDGRATKGPQREHRDPRVLEAIAEACADAVPDATGTISRLVHRVIWTLQDRYPGDDSLVIPSERTLWRWITERPGASHLTGSAKTRRSLANRPDRDYELHGEWAPGDHVQIDTTPLDLQVRTDAGSAVRPELTIMLDIATRSILSAVVCVDGTHSAILATVLARALTPYALRPSGAQETRELVASAWAGAAGVTQGELDDYRNRQPYIRPATITTDNGKIFQSKTFREACQRLEISLISSAVYTPTDKSHVERTFKSIGVEFAQHVRTYTGRSVEHRGTTASLEHAPTPLQLQELLEDWVSISWQNRPHSGLRDPLRPARKLTPNEMHDHYRRLVPEIHVPFGVDDYIGLLPVEKRTLQAYGITIDHRVYSSRRLAELRGDLDSAARSRMRVRRDPYNLFTVWLEHGDEYIPLQWRTTTTIAPFGANLRQLMRGSDTGAHDNTATTRVSLALQEGLWRARFGDPATGAVPALTPAVEEAPTDRGEGGEQAGGYRRMGGSGYLGDPDDEEDAWFESGGFFPYTDSDGVDLNGRLDD